MGKTATDTAGVFWVQLLFDGRVGENMSMFNRFYSPVCFALFFCVLLVPRLWAGDIAGEWEFAMTNLNEVRYARVVFKTDGEKIHGTLNELKLEGVAKEDQLTFSATRGSEHFGDFNGTIAGKTLKGTAVWSGDRKVSWMAQRPATPPATPQVHTFVPTAFHRVFSDAIAPALHIFPGDTVQTWTVDAGGIDSNGVRRSEGGNPQTGPFYVEGALPGDTLEVRLTRLRLNRDSGDSGTQIVPTALSPFSPAPKYSDKFDGTWVLDRERGVALLKNPSPHLTKYEVKLQPMLGCIAVAPPGHQALRTGFLGSYGGNLDYNQLREGTTVYLPVSAPGALLFIGDGHAAQGDGELTGDALETSMDVEFTVQLRKGVMHRNPRAENNDYLMALGIANSLPEALQAATSELAGWLEHEYHLQPDEAAIVLGTAMEYNIAEVVDPMVHVVARVRKDKLASLK